MLFSQSLYNQRNLLGLLGLREVRETQSEPSHNAYRSFRAFSDFLLIQLFDLLLEKLSEELSELIESNLARFVLIKYTKDDSVALILVILSFVLIVDPHEQRLDKSFHFFSLKSSRVVSIDRIED